MNITLGRRAALVFALALPAVARAATWRPTQTPRIIVPAAPGGITDIAARLLAGQAQASWGIPCVVDNKPGGGGVTGTLEMLRAAPDGHTVLMGNIGPQAIAYSLFRNLPYAQDALAPVSGMIRGPNALVVHPSVPANTVAEFVAHLRANPGKLNYGSPGIGQSPHLSAVWFLQIIGGQATHVPFRGAAPALQELLAGNIQFMFDNIITSAPQIEAGRIRALAVTSADRSALLPQTPAVRETMPELARFDVSTWAALFMNSRGPRDAVIAWNEVAREVLQKPETAERLARAGSVPHPGTPDEFATFVAAEVEKWREVIRREGLVMDMG